MQKIILLTLITLSIFTGCLDDSQLSDIDKLKGKEYKVITAFGLGPLKISDDLRWGSSEFRKNSKIEIKNDDLFFYLDGKILSKSKFQIDDGIVKQDIYESFGKRVKETQIWMDASKVEDICDNNYATNDAKEFLFFGKEELLCEGLNKEIKNYYINKFTSKNVVKKYNMIGEWNLDGTNITVIFNAKGNWTFDNSKNKIALNSQIVEKNNRIKFITNKGKVPYLFDYPITDKNGCLELKGYKNFKLSLTMKLCKK